MKEEGDRTRETERVERETCVFQREEHRQHREKEEEEE